MALSSSATVYVEGIERLEGSVNYHSWKIAMEMKLVDQDLWSVVEAETVDLANEDVKKKNLKAKAKILLSINPSLYSNVKSCATAKEAWKKLSDTYENKGLMRRMYLYNELENTTYSNSNGMQDYLNRMIDLQEKLIAIDAGLKQDEFVCRILRKLPDSYQPLITSLQTLEAEKLTTDMVKNLLLQEDTRRQTLHYDESMSALKINQKKYHKKKQEKNISKKDDEDSSDDEENEKPRFICYRCGKKGHVSRYCRNEILKENKGRKEKLLYANEDKMHEVKSERWCIDTGASTHMTKNKEYLTKDVTKIKTPVCMGNGERKIATEKGAIKMTLEVNGNQQPVKLKDVLYIPELPENILSVGEMTSKGYTVSFTKHKCYIKDNQGDLTATGTRDGNLYFLDVKCIKIKKEILSSEEPKVKNKTEVVLSVGVQEENNNVTEKKNETKIKLKDEEKSNSVEILNMLLIEDREAKEKQTEPVTDATKRKENHFIDENLKMVKKKFKSRIFWNEKFLNEEKRVLTDEAQLTAEKQFLTDDKLYLTEDKQILTDGKQCLIADNKILCNEEIFIAETFFTVVEEKKYLNDENYFEGLSDLSLCGTSSEFQLSNKKKKKPPFEMPREEKLF